MKLINQSFEILEQTDFSLVGIKKFIEKCGRVCYKSEDKITEDSYIKFVDNLIKRGHDRPLEFGTVHLKLEYSKFQGFMQALYSERIYNDIWMESNGDGEFIYITTNYRYYLDILKRFPWVAAHFDKSDSTIYPKRYTVHFITSRGIMDEFRTHVSLSHLAESTRYCNYSKGKFDNQVTFVIPSWCNSLIEGSEQNYSLSEINRDEIVFMDALQNAQNSYLSLLKLGWKPQEARDVLPLGIKSELISCGFEDAWENFIRRRSPKYGDPGAHPMAAEIANKLGEEFIKRGYITESIAK